MRAGKAFLCESNNFIANWAKNNYELLIEVVVTPERENSFE